MDKQVIETKVKQIIENYASPMVATLDSNLEDFNFDSLDRIEMILTLESEFDIEIMEERVLTSDFECWLEFKTVRDIVNYIETELKEA